MAQTPQRIRFRRASDASFRSYGPTDLRSVETDSGLQLVSRAVSVYQVPPSRSAARSYLRAEKPRTRKDTLLLEVLVDGPLSLYTKQGDRSHFYLESDEKLVELIKRHWLEKDKRTGFILKTSPWYRQQLPGYMHNCPNAQEQIPSTDRTIRSLSSVLVKYNRCTTKGRAVPLSTLLEFSLGVETRVVERRIPSVPSVWTSGYEVGVSAEVQYTRGDDYWAASGNLVAAQQPVNLTHRTLDQTFLQATILGRYYIGRWSVRPYLELGTVFAYRMRSERVTDPYLRDGDQFKMGAATGLGVQYRGFFVGLRGRMRESYLGGHAAFSRSVVAGVRVQL